MTIYLSTFVYLENKSLDNTYSYVSKQLREGFQSKRQKLLFAFSVNIHTDWPSLWSNQLLIYHWIAFCVWYQFSFNMCKYPKSAYAQHWSKYRSMESTDTLSRGYPWGGHESSEIQRIQVISRRSRCWSCLRSKRSVEVLNESIQEALKCA